MMRYRQFLTGILIAGMLISGVGLREDAAADTTIKLMVNPNKTTVYLGSGGIALTARARGKNLTYSWELLGPGKLDGKGSAVFYLLPDTIDGSSAQALITVTVKDATGQETSESITFDILVPPDQKPTAAPSPTPTPTSGFSLDGLEKEAQKETAEKAAWQAKLAEMETAFFQVQDYEKRDISIDLKVAGWERFLDVFSDDNPYSARDEELRGMANERIGALTKAPSKKEEPSPQPTISEISVARTPSSIWTEPITGMEFVWIPEGCYQMGCVAAPKYCRDDEKPPHQVCLDGFWMGKYEVTQAQWTQMLGENPSHFGTEEDADNRPVESISWKMAQEFIQKLNEKSEKGTYRLPSEAEWEYACRAGSSTLYSFGDDETELGKYGWYSKNSKRKNSVVGQLEPNAFGLYDMHGNVWEWTADPWHENYEGAPSDAMVWEEGGKASDRILRGGSWNNGVGDARCANRHRGKRNSVMGGYTIGVRLVYTEE